MPPKKVIAADELKQAQRHVRRLLEQRDNGGIALHRLKRKCKLLRREFGRVHAFIGNAAVEDERLEQVTDRTLADLDQI